MVLVFKMIIHFSDFQKELKDLAERSQLPSGQSFFHTPNLELAIAVTEQSFEKDNDQLDEMLHLAISDSLKYSKSKLW